MARCLARSVTLLASVLLVLLPAGPSSSSPGLFTEDLTGPLDPQDLADEIAGPGVSVSNVSFSGAEQAGGTFSGGTGIIGFEDGVILSSGDIANVVGPNMEDGKTTAFGTPGDADLTALSGFPTFDASVLEFDFVPDKSPISFQYAFSSDEYNEFVNTQFNDAFGFFVNGMNCAVVSGDAVSINTINNGNPHGTDPRSHPELYRNNDLSDGGGAIDTEMDGLTVVLTCTANVTANATNHMKLAIADASDHVLDSAVFLQGGSLTTQPPQQPLQIVLSPDEAQNEAGTSHTVTATVTRNGQPVSGVLVSFSVTMGPNAGQSSDPAECSPAGCSADSNGQVSWTYTSNAQIGTDTIQACVDDQGTQRCAEVMKEWRDTTPPDATCVPTTNPAGKNTPPAGESSPGQNEDGFYKLNASDALDPNPQIFVRDTGSGKVFGPFADGTRIKYTEANGATPSQKQMGGPNSSVQWHLKGRGDAAVFGRDARGNTSDEMLCRVSPPPK